MEELKILPTRNTPEVILSPDGLISIKGRSISENASEFYEPVNNWIEIYLKTPAEITIVDFTLEYFNSASTKMLMRVIQQITTVALKNKKFIFNWYYDAEDDDILERGQFFSSILEAKFNFIKIS